MTEMIEVNAADLEGAALDWAVAKSCEDVWYNTDGEFGQATGWLVKLKPWDNPLNIRLRDYTPSTDWSQGGPLIERYVFRMEQTGTHTWIACLPKPKNGQWLHEKGATPLIAAMRTIVVAELGETVQVPAELVEAS